MSLGPWVTVAVVHLVDEGDFLARRSWRMQQAAETQPVSSRPQSSEPVRAAYPVARRHAVCRLYDDVGNGIQLDA